MLIKKFNIGERYKQKEFFDFISDNLNYRKISYCFIESTYSLDIIGLDFIYKINFDTVSNSFNSIIKNNKIDLNSLYYKYDPVIMAIIMYDDFLKNKEKNKTSKSRTQKNVSGLNQNNKTLYKSYRRR